MAEGIIKHTYPIRVRYADTDKMGVMYNGNYFTFFEIGRTEMLRHYGLPYSDLEKSGYMLPLLEAHAEYINSAFYDDLLMVEASIKPEHKAVLTIKYNIFRDNTPIATGHTKHVFINSETRKPVRPPKQYVDLIRKFQKNLEADE